MARDGWVCGIDAGSFKTPSYVAWLSGSSFLLDLCCPTVTRPLPKPPSGVQGAQTIDHVDAMLCAIAAQSTVAGSNASEPLGDEPYVDKEASVLREGFIVVPSRGKG